MKSSLSQKGFSLFEVMLAFMIFAVFILAFTMSQSSNIRSSSLLQEETILLYLARKVIDEQLINPPEFTNALANSKKTKSFEDDDHTNYSYTIEYKKFLVPDFSKLTAQKDAAKQDQAMQKIIFDNFRDNLEKIIWQLQVTITNKVTEYNYTLSTWVVNDKEKIKLNLSF